MSLTVQHPSQMRDSADVVRYTTQADSLSRDNKDSSVVYLNKAYASLKNLPAGPWKVRQHGQIAQQLFRAGALEQSEEIFLQAIAEARKMDSLLLAEMQDWAGNYYLDRGAHSKALELFKSAAATYELLEQNEPLAVTLLSIGIIFDERGLYDKSLENYFKASDIYESLKDTLGRAHVLNNVAISYAKQKDYLSSIEYYEKALSIYRKQSDSTLAVNTKINLAVTYKNVGEYEKADQYLHDALVFYTHQNEPYALAVVYHNRGELKVKQQLTLEAMQDYETSIRYSALIDAREIMAKNYLALAALYFKNDQPALALKSAKTGLEIAKNLQMPETERDIHKVMADLYQQQRDYRSALEAYRQYSALSDSLFNETRLSNIHQLRTQYEVFTKDEEIETLKRERELQEERSAIQSMLNRYLVIGGVVMLILMALLAVAYFRTRKLNKLLYNQKQLLIEQHEEIQASQEELSRTNGTLMKINQEKDEIISMVAHDLRSPLNQIKGILFLINAESGQSLSRENHEYLNMINEVTEVMKQRINRMLNIEALNAGKVNLNAERLPAHDIIHSVANNFYEQAKQKQINLIVEDFQPDVYVHADRNYLLQVYENLVANALKFSSSGKSVWLKISQSDGEVLFHVKDQGPGIAPSEQTKLFSKFQSLSAKPTGGEDSTGLGLSIVKKYVEAMNGRVWCESELGRGAEFVVELPAASN